MIGTPLGVVGHRTQPDSANSQAVESFVRWVGRQPVDWPSNQVQWAAGFGSRSPVVGPWKIHPAVSEGKQLSWVLAYRH